MLSTSPHFEARSELGSLSSLRDAQFFDACLLEELTCFLTLFLLKCTGDGQKPVETENRKSHC
jgi:hypothetical protein